MGGGKIYFIDNRNKLKVLFDCKIGVGKSLRLNALCCVYYKYCTLAGIQRT